MSLFIQASWTIEGSSLPSSWPQTGTIEFHDYGLQYRKGLELALKGISVRIQEREKVQTSPLMLKLNIKTKHVCDIVVMQSILIITLFDVFRLVLWEELVQENHLWLLEFSGSWRQQKERST